MAGVYGAKVLPEIPPMGSATKRLMTLGYAQLSSCDIAEMSSGLVAVKSDDLRCYRLGYLIANFPTREYSVLLANSLFH